MKRRGASRITPGRELKNFTNRERELSVFRRVLDGPEGSPLSVIMFYGVGGIGKTWLLRRLRETLGEPPAVPAARLDFDTTTGGAAFHHDSSFALGKIRRQLDVDCPRFDLAYAMLRFRQGAGDEPLLKHSSTMGVAWELVVEGAQAGLGNFPGGSLLLWLGKKGGKFGGDRFKNSALWKWFATKA